MIRSYLQKLFAHEQWANAKVFDALLALPNVPRRSRELCGHILAAHDFWDKRFHGQTVNFADFTFFPELSLEQCAELNREAAGKWQAFIAALPEPLDEPTVTFPGRDGKPLTFRVIDGLTQLHGHSIHHRAQIVVDMRGAGLEPVFTDYILYCHSLSRG